MLIRKQYNNPEGNIPKKMVFDPTLGKSLHFTEDDLVMNRDNLISDRQQQRFNTCINIKNAKNIV